MSTTAPKLDEPPSVKSRFRKAVSPIGHGVVGQWSENIWECIHLSGLKIVEKQGTTSQSKKEPTMNDIVERLNEAATKWDFSESCPHAPEIMRDAIAEIMALRTTIEQLRSIVGVAMGDGPSFAAIRRDIRE